MSGYLAHLVARMAPGAPGVRPRPVSRYEPAAPAGLLPWLAAEAPDAGQEDALPTREPVWEPARRELGRAEQVPPAVDATPRRPRPAVQVHATPPARSVTESEREAPTGRPAGPGYRRPSPAPPAEGLPGEAELRLTPVPAPAPGTASEPGPAPHQAMAAPPRETPAPAGPVVIPHTPGVAASMRPILPEPARAEPPPLGRRLRSLAAKPSPAEPAIHITIGRVEVIAAPPVGPAHPAPRQPDRADRPSGVMSLDEYLRSREQEGRP